MSMQRETRRSWTVSTRLSYFWHQNTSGTTTFWRWWNRNWTRECNTSSSTKSSTLRIILCWQVTSVPTASASTNFPTKTPLFQNISTRTSPSTYSSLKETVSTTPSSLAMWTFTLTKNETKSSSICIELAVSTLSCATELLIIILRSCQNSAPGVFSWSMTQGICLMTNCYFTGFPCIRFITERME